MNKVDFLAIGDIVIDAFIRLKDAHVHCKIDADACELCVRFGDKIPYESVTVVPAVGNAANAAVCASRLGLNSALVSNLGDDKEGGDCLAALRTDKVNTEFMKAHPGMKTNYHYVLWYDVDRTILIKHEEYPYELPAIGEPSWVYFSSVGVGAFPFHLKVADYLGSHPNIKLAFQPGKNEIKLGKEKLAPLYQRAEIFFCNLEEAEVILGIETKDVLKLSQGIAALGPKMVAISDGPNGAYLYLPPQLSATPPSQGERESSPPYEGGVRGGELWHLPIFPDIAPPLDRTGAGDAFAATFTAGLALGLSPLQAFAWGPVNSMSVVQEIGAQRGLLIRTKLEEYLTKAPAEYKPRKV